MHRLPNIKSLGGLWVKGVVPNYGEGGVGSTKWDQWGGGGIFTPAKKRGGGAEEIIAMLRGGGGTQSFEVVSKQELEVLGIVMMRGGAQSLSIL